MGWQWWQLFSSDPLQEDKCIYIWTEPSRKRTKGSISNSCENKPSITVPVAFAKLFNYTWMGIRVRALFPRNKVELACFFFSKHVNFGTPFQQGTHVRPLFCHASTNTQTQPNREINGETSSSHLTSLWTLYSSYISLQFFLTV